MEEEQKTEVQNQTVATDYSNGTDTSWSLVYQETTGGVNAFQMFLYNPQTTKQTSFSVIGNQIRASDAANSKAGGALTVSTSYTGFTLFPTSGTLTGGVRVYGYQKS